MTRLLCSYCNEPIKKRIPTGEDDGGYVELTLHPGGIDRAWHHKCHPDYLPPESPLQAAMQKAKHAIADAQRLGPYEYASFKAIVTAALDVQREA